VCGIAGFTHIDHPPEQGRIARVTRSLVHRGPDQQGTYESALVSLGAVRLKIIDLQGGDQPIYSEDGDSAIVFNGEIYNHRELRDELQQLGRRFRSHCDTEVVLQAFLEWDTACFSRLRGMFAVALWSERDRRLVLARDRVGIKPLYVSHAGRDLYFASELKAILGHPEIPRALNLSALSDYLSLNYVPGPDTLVEGISKLPPGYFLEWMAGTTRSEAWWKLEFAPRRSWTLDAAKEQLDSLLRQSVREHLISDVPLGVWSSGGIDSSTILHYAAEAAPGLKTFSVAFRGRSFDESAYFRQIAGIYGTDHHEFDLNPEVELGDAIQEFAYYSDEPSADAGALPVWFLSRMSRRHVTVALSGDGADELFGGYLTYLADLAVRPVRAIPPVFRRALLGVLQRHLPVSDDKISLEYKLKRLVEGSLLPPDAAHFFWNGTWSPSQKQALCPGLNGAGLERLASRIGTLPGIGRLNRYMLVDQNYYLPDDILYKVDRMSMAHSLEVRPPFLDNRIVEFAASLPENLKIRRGSKKYLLKQLMKGKLPPAILNRAKTGFDIPTHDWFRGPLRDLLLDTLSPDAVRNTGVFDYAAVQRFVRDHMERRVNIGYHLWGLLTLFLWMTRWKIEGAPPRRQSDSRVFAAN
jgi:asparagine synthase (glutamine-hydrolysing)